jgi:hypothetical protein
MKCIWIFGVIGLLLSPIKIIQYIHHLSLFLRYEKIIIGRRFGIMCTGYGFGATGQSI